MARFLNAWIFAVLCAPVFAQSSGFYDPTRPPAAFLPGAPTAASSAAIEAPLVLQSVLLSPQRKSAVISGQSVAIGQSIRGYQLRSLGPSQAQLYGSNGMIILKLLPVPRQNTARTPAVEPEKTSRGDSK
ncbi:hypothetical protein [Uliginosibacterium gangwonense]|uniref:hypothetical protein n=1 Tax=Uliginosibacterium gangwonense TaxID=392736 RepID=UPI000376862B|nr:hypothetical protein [Uliginosibacterium gangwonense]